MSASGPTRKLGPWLAAMLVAGNMIGSGIYTLPAALGAVGSVSLLGWVVATVGAFAAAAVFANLSRVSQSLDGVVGYTEEGLSARVWGVAAVVVAWALINAWLVLDLLPIDREGVRTLIRTNAGVLAAVVLFAILSRLIPRGAPRPDASKELGRFWGFAMALIYWMGIWVGVVAIAVSAVGYLSFFVPALGSPLGRSFGTVGAIWVMTGLNLVGPRLVARFGGVTLAAGLIPVLTVATLGWLWFNPHIFAASWNVSGQSDFQGMQASMVGAFWAYTGLESAAVVAAVVREPEKNVPFATLVGTGLAAVVYLAASTVIMGLAPAREFAASAAPFALAFGKVAGPTAAMIVAACALMKTSGTTAGWVLMVAETARAGADVHLFPGRLAPEKRDQVPTRILLCMAVVMSLTALASNSPTLGKQFSALLDVSTIWSIIPYVLCAVALVRLARGLASANARLAARFASVVAVVFTGWTIATGELVTLWLTLGLAAVTLVLWFAVGRRAHLQAASDAAASDVAA